MENIKNHIYPQFLHVAPQLDSRPGSSECKKCKDASAHTCFIEVHNYVCVFDDGSKAQR